jgi:ABC-type uncharacterized transport system permease subunit
VRWPLALERRLVPSIRLQFVLPGLAIVIGLLLGAILLSLMGTPPLEAYQAMAGGAFGDVYGLSETLVKAAPLLLTGLGVGLAFRSGLWNIGAEGQFSMGAMGATWIALTYPALPAPLLQPLMLVAGCAAGALWGLIPGGLRAYRGVNEIITTLMLNYIAILWVDFLVFGFPFAPPLPQSALIPSIPGEPCAPRSAVGATGGRRTGRAAQTHAPRL